MEKFITLLIPALLSVFLVRMLFLPIRLVCKLALHSGCGFLCLWILNITSAFTGILLPINAATVLISGFLGIPGIGIIVLLEILA